MIGRGRDVAKRGARGLTTAAIGVGVIASVCGVSLAGVGSAGASGAAIKIGLITTESGPIASDFVGVANDFKARVAYQNKLGGVHGHKLDPIVVNDGGTPTGNLAAAHTLVTSDHVTIVVEETALSGGSSSFLHSQGVPVTGGDYSGPTWGTYTNMFGDWGSTNPTAPPASTQGQIFKKLGAKSIATAGFHTSPSSAEGAKDVAASAKAAGIKVALVTTSMALTLSNASDVALAVKNSGATALYAVFGIAGSTTVLTDALQDGATIKYTEVDGGYYTITGTPAQTLYQGAIFGTYWLPEQFGTKTAKHVESELKKYGGLASGRADYNFTIMGWLGANLAITGLEKAKSTSSKSLISALKSLKGYTATGLLPHSVNYSQFGKAAPLTTDVGADYCLYGVTLKGSDFKPFNNKKPICGHKLSTATG